MLLLQRRKVTRPVVAAVLLTVAVVPVIGHGPCATEAVNSACCGPDDGACTAGTPSTCDAGCAAAFLPFWGACERNFSPTLGVFDGVVTMCRATSASANSPLRLRVVSSIEKVLPVSPEAGEAPTATAETRIELALARGEYESAQLIVTPGGAELGGFTVRPGAALCSGGASELCLAQTVVTVHPVAWVNQLVAHVPGNRVGWTPDPLLPQGTALTLPAGRQMSFLVKVQAPLDSLHAPPAGTFDGTIRLSWTTGGGGELEVPLSVTVFNFELPKWGHLTTCLFTTWSDPKNMWPSRSWSNHDDVLAAMLLVGEVAVANRMYPCTLANGLNSWNWKGQFLIHK